MTTWPLTLPQAFTVDNYQETLPNNVVATNMDQGPPKRRRRSVSNIGNVTGSMVMSSAQWAILKYFFQNTVMETLPFDFPDPNNPADTISVAFTPTAQPSKKFYVTGKWTVTLSFDVQPT